MRVLVIGSGAREHAIVARLATEREGDAVLCAPGNPGIARVARTINVNASDIDALLAIAVREAIDLTVVGPEVPLSLGIADRFAAAGRLLFGPTADAARLETSKAFAKAFMERHHVPTARFRTCESVDDALGVVRGGTFALPVVLKADGLAAGKGVVIAETREAAEAAVIAAMSERRFGDAGNRLNVEECLTGPEVSFFPMRDGTNVIRIATAQYHKRIFDDDRGPNTGGMGAFAPSPLVDEPLAQRVMKEIVEPVVRGMAGEGHPFRGFLYAGLMLTLDGPKVIEFNVRLGDPEAQVVLPLIEGDLAGLLIAAADGNLAGQTIATSADVTVGVVLASAGYPASAMPGVPI